MKKKPQKNMKCQAILGNWGANPKKKHYCKKCGKELRITCTTHEGAPAGCGVYSQWCLPEKCDCETIHKNMKEKIIKFVGKVVDGVGNFYYDDPKISDKEIENYKKACANQIIKLIKSELPNKIGYSIADCLTKEESEAKSVYLKGYEDCLNQIKSKLV